MNTHVRASFGRTSTGTEAIQGYQNRDRQRNSAGAPKLKRLKPEILQATSSAREPPTIERMASGTLEVNLTVRIVQEERNMTGSGFR